MIEARKTIDKAIVAGLYSLDDPLEPDLMLDELASLVAAAGGQVVGRTFQRRGRGPAKNRRSREPQLLPSSPLLLSAAPGNVSLGNPASAGAAHADTDTDAAAAAAAADAADAIENALAPDAPEGASTIAVSPATFIGRGKAEHLAELVEANEANLVVFDNELTPAQIRELERIIGCRVLDRSEIILDIFAARARSREAKVQVELAQLEYTAPRLRGMWSHLERQAGTGGAGGLGLKGPGEKQIEIDRRLVKKRISRLKSELAELHGRKQREVAHRTQRHFCVGLVGYTNAGKSTLMNALTAAGVLSADQLFATVDTKTRTWTVAPGVDVMLSDTVGFVRDLPHSLVASFRATLEEALHADLLLHVIDASHPQALQQIATVERVLSELGLPPGRMSSVLNKVDAVADPDALAILRSRLFEPIVISARTGEGLDELAANVASRYRESCARVSVSAPLASGRMQAYVRAHAQVVSESYDDVAWMAEIYIPDTYLGKLASLCPEAVLQRMD